MLSYRLRKKILKAIYPNALQDPIFAEIEVLRVRLASDPEVQRRKRDERRAHLRSAMPFVVVAMLVNVAVFSRLAYDLPLHALGAGTVCGALILWMGGVGQVMRP